MKNRLLLSVLFICVSVLSFSQTTPIDNFVIKGQVIDSLTKETIPYATLKIVKKSNPVAVVKALATDENGKFQFTLNKEGEYLLTANFIGKTALSQTLVIGSSKVLDLGKISMTDDSKLLSEIVVTADKPLVKVDLDKITYSMEDDPEAKTNNVLEMLKKVPLITVDGEENIQLKGSSNFRIYLNGKPSNMITNNPKDVLRSMPANTIKDIQVITDPGAKYDAEGVAGIINIITQKQSSLGGYTATVNSNVDSFGGYGMGGYLSLKYGKIGFTGNYNLGNYDQPKGAFNSFRTDSVDSDRRDLYQYGTTKSRYKNQYGSGELSYEIDTLNLINVGYNRFAGSSKTTMDWLIEMQNNNGDVEYNYNRKSRSNQAYGGTELNVDYQRTFKKKDQLLTSSYRYGHSPNDSQSDNVISDITGQLPQFAVTNRQFSDAKMNEHTFQIDFSTPFNNIHSLEIGAKYIIRLNASTSGFDTLNIMGGWDNVPKKESDQFRHEQDILASYAGYSAKFKKWGIKTGLRYEGTWLYAKYPLATFQNFSVDYSNLVPSATLTYQIKPSQNIRLGYNMRILRPNIWQLNPYSDSSNPNFIQRGNTSLDAVQSNALSANYGFFNPKFNLNVNMGYNFENNAIEQVTSIIDNGVSLTTYENIGERKNLNISAYLNWNLIKDLRIFANLGGGYTDIKANNDIGLSNSGFNGSAYTGIQYQLAKTWRFGLNAGYFGRNVYLQGRSPSIFFHSFNVGKSYLNDRLNFRIYASNPFMKEMVFTTRESTPLFISESTQRMPRRQVGFTVSFRFGEMKAQIKKAQRGITNDDTMSSGSGQGGAQSGGQGGQ